MQESTRNPFKDTYRDQTVLVIGHTGFKGSWLSAWLQELGAKVFGISNGIPTNPSHYESAKINQRLVDHDLDIRNVVDVKRAVEEIEPDFVFHLAAQALVKQSYREPLDTIATNTMGTAHVLEALRGLNRSCVGVMVTSDKCYDNVETYYGYRETDPLGGKDPYSASKGAAEIIIHSYAHSFFTSPEQGVRIGVVRAGNVVGGGDWAADRLIPDIVRAWDAGETVSIRNPAATRPWQHVLEPLSGYLLLGAELARRPELHAEPFNFGPKAEDVYPVAEVADYLVRQLPGLDIKMGSHTGEDFHEAGLLKLSCDKALHLLKWRPVLSFEETMGLTAGWYQNYYQNYHENQDDVALMTREQLGQYCQLASERGLPWA